MQPDAAAGAAVTLVPGVGIIHRESNRAILVRQPFAWQALGDEINAQRRAPVAATALARAILAAGDVVICYQLGLARVVAKHEQAVAGQIHKDRVSLVGGEAQELLGHPACRVKAALAPALTRLREQVVDYRSRQARGGLNRKRCTGTRGHEVAVNQVGEAVVGHALNHGLQFTNGAVDFAEAKQIKRAHQARLGITGHSDT